MRFIGIWTLALFSLITAHSLAADSTTIETFGAAATVPGLQSTTAATVPLSDWNRFYLKAEFRPTWATSSSEFDMRNTFELGYGFSPDLRLLYNQAIEFDLFKQGQSGVGFNFSDARLELDINNVLRDGSRLWSLDFQPRLHLPIDRDLRQNGFITAFKPQVNLSRQFSDSLSFTLSMAPALFVYTQSTGTLEGNVATNPHTQNTDTEANLTANPIFENTVEFVTKYAFTKSLKLEIPLRFVLTRFRHTNPESRFSNRWAFGLVLKSELIYALSPAIGLGLAIETASLVSDDLARFTLGEGFRKPVAQFVLIAAL